MTNRDALVRRWRKCRPLDGRLYWRAANPGMDWDTDHQGRREIARVVNHPIVTHYYTIQAIIDDIERAESEAQ